MAIKCVCWHCLITLWMDSLITWTSYQIRKIAGCACAGNAGNVFPRRRFQRKPLVSDPGMHHGTCVTHVPWCMSGSLTCGDGENVPGIPSACAPAILRIWQEAHWGCIYFQSQVLADVQSLQSSTNPVNVSTSTKRSVVNQSDQFLKQSAHSSLGRNICATTGELIHHCIMQWAVPCFVQSLYDGLVQRLQYLHC